MSSTNEEAIRVVAEEPNPRAVRIRAPRACTVPVDYAEPPIDGEDFESKPKAKRGRPRKNPEGDEKASDTPKAKPGRPRKISGEDDDKPKAKPGRPRKNPEQDQKTSDTPKAKPEEDQKTDDKPKAKPGRPRKYPVNGEDEKSTKKVDQGVIACLERKENGADESKASDGMPRFKKVYSRKRPLKEEKKKGDELVSKGPVKRPRKVVVGCLNKDEVSEKLSPLLNHSRRVT